MQLGLAEKARVSLSISHRPELVPEQYRITDLVRRVPDVALADNGLEEVSGLGPAWTHN